MATGETYEFGVGAFSLLFFADGGGPRQATGFLPDAPPDELVPIIRGLGLDPDALDFSLKPILIIAGEQRILIDTGLGGEMSNLPASLAAQGIPREAIDLIVITHGHGDHINGILDADGAFVYPNADYVLWRSEWEYWTAEVRFAPTDESPARRIWAALQANSGRVRLLDADDMEIVPGVRAVPAPGHTGGQIGIEVESEGEKFLHVADAAHHYFQLNCPQWSPRFDIDPLQSVETRRRLFERAANEGLLFSAYHFPFPGVGRIVKTQAGMLTWRPGVE